MIRSYRRAECHSDLFLVGAKLKIRLKRFFFTNLQTPHQVYNKEKLQETEISERFVDEIKCKIPISAEENVAKDIRKYRRIFHPEETIAEVTKSGLNKHRRKIGISEYLAILI